MPDLIIVDEADRLKMAGLEQMRALYDKGNLGLIFIGMPGLEKRLARYAQLYSRVGFVHQFRALSTEEMQFILAHKWAQLGLRYCHVKSKQHENNAEVRRQPHEPGPWRAIKHLH